jgi:hypothetical protein
MERKVYKNINDYFKGWTTTGVSFLPSSGNNELNPLEFNPFGDFVLEKLPENRTQDIEKLEQIKALPINQPYYPYLPIFDENQFLPYVEDDLA